MKKASILMIIGSALLLGLYFYPLWNIQLFAPQYPEGIGMDIYINDIQGEGEFDLDKIDMLNHYIGMKPIPKVHEMAEFTIFPIVIGIMMALGILIGIIGFTGKIGPVWMMGWLVLMVVLGVIGMLDFNAWLIDYGTDLDPTASIKLLDYDGQPMKYNPPLIGHKQLLNFDVDSWPGAGAYFLMSGMFLIFVAFLVGRKEKSKSIKAKNYEVSYS